MQKIIPVKYSEIVPKFGDPADLTDMVKKKFPFKMYLNGDKNLPCINFFGHKYIADAVIEAFDEILDIYGLDFIRKNNLDNYGGCYEPRASRGSSRISVHSWGLAVDYLPHLGRLGKPPLIPYHIVQAFRNRGFEWGGDWNRPDGMHFTAVIE